MNVIAMINEIPRVANAMIRETPLPDFSAPELQTKRPRISAFNQLNSSLQRHILRGSQKQMHVLRHQNKSMQKKFSLPPITIESFQEKPHVRLNHEQPPALPSQERHKISPRRRNRSSRLHEQTSAAGSRITNEPIAARVELVPFPVKILPCEFQYGNPTDSAASLRQPETRPIGKGTSFTRANEPRSMIWL